MTKKTRKDKRRKLLKRRKKNIDDSITYKKEKVKEYVLQYVENQTSKPALVSIDENPQVALKLGNLLVAFSACERSIGNRQFDFSSRTNSSISQNDIDRLEIITKNECFSEDDKVHLGHLIQTSCSKPCLIPYVSKQMNWIFISILSAHYLSSMILMRSIFELIIDLLANAKGGMSAKIQSISLFDDNQKSDIKKSWNNLCSWSHPYNKWLKNMCSRYMALPPLYHPEHFKTSVELLEEVIDLFLVLCKEHFNMNIQEFRKTEEQLVIDLSGFHLFTSCVVV